MTKQEKLVAFLQSMLAVSHTIGGALAVALALTVDEDKIPDNVLRAGRELWLYAHKTDRTDVYEGRPEWLPEPDMSAVREAIAELGRDNT